MSYSPILRSMRYAVNCFYCPKTGPLGLSTGIAEADAEAAGWTHMPHVGGFERWRCPECQEKLRQKLGLPEGQSVGP